MHRLALILASGIPLLTAAQLPRVESVTTEKVDFGPGGAIRIEGSTGELNIEGWDQSAVEMTVTRYMFSGDEAKARHELNRVEVSKPTVAGNEVTIMTTRKHVLGVHVDYRVRVPRNSRLLIRHGTGDVVVYYVAGDIDAYTKVGGIVLQLPPDGDYSVDA